MKTIKAFAGMILFQILIIGPIIADADTKDFVMRTLMESEHIGEPGKADRIRIYSEKKRISADEILKILAGFVEDENLESYVRQDAISVIGLLRLEDALPVLKKISRSDNELLRTASVLAIARIGGEGLLDFAEQVVSDRQKYKNIDRHELYWQLSRYLRNNSERKSEKNREPIRQFLSDAISKEPNVGNLLLLDKELSNADEQYKMSYEREDILKKIEDSKSPRDRKYAEENLKMLRELPKKKETRMKSGKKPGKINGHKS